jgi:hypothetical protein
MKKIRRRKKREKNKPVRNMVVTASVILIFLGILLMTYELYIPTDFSDYGMIMVNHISGLMLLLIGLVIIGVRLRQTGVSSMLDLPSEDRIKCFHSPGYSVNTKILNGKLLENNLIKAEGKLINYKGGGFRIAGHECIRVHGNVVPNVPEKIGETLARYKEKYGADDIYKLKALYNKLKNINENELLAPQLRAIPELGTIVEDPTHFRQLCDMNPKDIKQMAETLWDGTSIRLEPDIDEFIQTATPAQVHQYAQKEYMSMKNRDKMLKKETRGDLLKYAIPIGIMLFMAALGLGVFMQMGGG